MNETVFFFPVSFYSYAESYRTVKYVSVATSTDFSPDVRKLSSVVGLVFFLSGLLLRLCANEEKSQYS